MDFTSCFKDGIRYNLIITNKDRAFDIIASFIVLSVEKSKKCFYLVDGRDKEDVAPCLKELGYDMDNLIGDGKLEVKSARAFYIDDGTYKDLSNMERLIQNALRDGFSGAAVVADKECFLSSAIEEEVFFEYERKVDELLKRYSVSGLSLYNIDKFGVDTVFSISNINANFLYKGDNKVFVHNEENRLFSNDEILSIIYSYLKKREILWRKNVIYQLLSNLSIELFYKRDERDIIGTALNLICKSIKADYGLIALTDSMYNDNSNTVTYNLPSDLLDSYQDGLYRGEIGMHNFGGRVKYVTFTPNDVKYELSAVLKKHGVVSGIILPLKYNGTIYGHMGLGTRDKGTNFEDYSEFLYRICETIAKMVVEYRHNMRIQDLRSLNAKNDDLERVIQELSSVFASIEAYIDVIKNKVRDREVLNYVSKAEKNVKDGIEIINKSQKNSSSVKNKANTGACLCK